MKTVNAYLKLHKLPEIVEALHRIDGLSGLTVLHEHGFSRSLKKNVRIANGERDQDAD